MFTYSQLKTYITVYETKNFTESSKILFISQPAVSKTIKSLEEKYQVSFFDRSRDGLKPTQEGKMFYEFATKTINSYYELTKKIEPSKNLIILYSPVITSTITSALNDFHKKFPQINVRLITDFNPEYDYSFEIITKLDYTLEEKLHLLFSEEILLAMNINNILTKKPEINHKDLKSVNFVIHNNHFIEDYTKLIFNKYEVDPKIVFGSDNFSLIKKYLSLSSDAVSFASHSSLSSTPIIPNIIGKRLNFTPNKRYIYLKDRRKTLNDAEKVFKKFIQSFFNQFPENIE